MSALTRYAFLMCGLPGLLLARCSSYDPNERIDPTVGTVDSGAGLAADFTPVAQMLVFKCGSIDCHGSKYRNFRLYGFGSERLDSSMNTEPGSAETTPAEVVEDYNSMVALEPTIYLQVIRESGAHPERLTLVRKARNLEDHKGNKPIADGDQADICLQSWLQGRLLPDACYAAVPRLAPNDAGAGAGP
jgi:hypothetical protein